MDLTQADIAARCTDGVFERGQRYRAEGRIQRRDRFGDIVTATVQGSTRYEVRVDLGGTGVDVRCTCPYDGDGDCKHAVALLLDVASDPPPDASEDVNRLLDGLSDPELRGFVRDVLEDNPPLRDRFRSRFGASGRSVEEYREEITALFEEHTQNGPMVTTAIDFSQYFDIAAEFQATGQFEAAARVYRVLFETIDDHDNRVDAAYDHYARSLQSAIDGYVDSVVASEPSAEAFEEFAGVLATRASSAAPPNREPFRRALEELERRWDG